MLKRVLRPLVVRWRRLFLSRRASRFDRYRASAAYLANRQNIQRIDVQPGLVLEVFCKDISGVGGGPACSVLVAGEEILRLDCFGPGAGHMHTDLLSLGPATEDRLRFREQTVPEQIERAIFEISSNLSYYAARSPWPAAWRCRPDPKLLGPALERARAVMLELHAAGSSREKAETLKC